MSDDTRNREPNAAPVAEVQERSSISIVWLLPAVAILLGGWLLFKSIRDRGVSIEVTFQTADGLEAGKTAIRYRDVQVGLVESIVVAETRDHVVAQITIDREAKDMLVADTEFWVVRPRATLQGISGLGTLLSGAYIAIEPGTKSVANPTVSFEGLEDPPVLDRDAPGARFVLTAESLGSISVGSPIYFRGVGVGEVTKHALDADARGVTLEVFINDPHHHLVLHTTRFWDASGISVRAGADGLEINTASLEALMIGGLEFDSPRGHHNSTPAPDGTTFQLYAQRRDVDLDIPGAERFVCYFEDSLRGLSVRAPVEYRGIEVGHVASIDVVRTAEGDVLLPVTIAFNSESLGVPPGRAPAERRAALESAVARGVRAKLASGSLLTGALFVELVVDGSAPPRLVGAAGAKLPELPTIPSGLAALEKSIGDAVTKIDAILTKVEALPLDELVQNASDAAASIDRLASSPDLENAIKSAGKALDEVEPALAELRTVLRDVDSGIQTVISEMQSTTEQLRTTLAAAEKTMAGIDQTVGPDSVAQAELARTLSEVARAARSMRELASYLERHPEALLSGKSDSGGQ